MQRWVVGLHCISTPNFRQTPTILITLEVCEELDLSESSVKLSIMFDLNIF